MSFDWKEMWENHAEHEAQEMEASAEDVLLNQIKNGYYGSYYVIWRVIAERNNPQKSVPILLAALEKIETDRAVYYDDLNAIHCAEAICKLLKINDEAQKSDLVYLNRLESLKYFKEKYKALFS